MTKNWVQKNLHKLKPTDKSPDHALTKIVGDTSCGHPCKNGKFNINSMFKWVHNVKSWKQKNDKAKSNDPRTDEIETYE